MRKGLLAKLHIGKADVGLSEEEWRALILEVSKNRTSSTKELKTYELEDLLTKLKGLGFHPTITATAEQYQKAEDNFKADKAIERLMSLLHLNKNYISAMSKNMFSISKWDYLQIWQKEKIIKTLENRKLRAKNSW